jgi:hypothetical protein
VNFNNDLFILLSQEIAKAERAYLDDPQSFIGWHWWQISPEETNVFDLHPILWARMLPAYECFEAFIGSATWEDAPERTDEILAVARSIHPEWVEAPGLSAFQSFAKTYAGLSYRDSHAFFDKETWQLVRDRIRTYMDEEEDDEQIRT